MSLPELVAEAKFSKSQRLVPKRSSRFWLWLGLARRAFCSLAAFPRPLGAKGRRQSRETQGEGCLAGLSKHRISLGLSFFFFPRLTLLLARGYDFTVTNGLQGNFYRGVECPAHVAFFFFFHGGSRSSCLSRGNLPCPPSQT